MFTKLPSKKNNRFNSKKRIYSYPLLGFKLILRKTDASFKTFITILVIFSSFNIVPLLFSNNSSTVEAAFPGPVGATSPLASASSGNPSPNTGWVDMGIVPFQTWQNTATSDPTYPRDTGWNTGGLLGPHSTSIIFDPALNKPVMYFSGEYGLNNGGSGLDSRFICNGGQVCRNTYTGRLGWDGTRWALIDAGPSAPTGEPNYTWPPLIYSDPATGVKRARNINAGYRDDANKTDMSVVYIPAKGSNPAKYVGVYKGSVWDDGTNNPAYGGTWVATSDDGKTFSRTAGTSTFIGWPNNNFNAGGNYYTDNNVLYYDDTSNQLWLYQTAPSNIANRFTPQYNIYRRVLDLNTVNINNAIYTASWSAPVLTVSNGVYSSLRPMIYKSQNTYFMIYSIQSADGTGTPIRAATLQMATSPNGFNWTNVGKLTATCDPNNASRSNPANPWEVCAATYNGQPATFNISTDEAGSADRMHGVYVDPATGIVGIFVNTYGQIRLFQKKFYFNTPPQGNFDGDRAIGGTCKSLDGWAFDKDDFTKPVQVLLYADGPLGTGTPVAALSANLPRPDVQAYFLIPANGGFDPGPNHGFSWTIDVAYKDAVAHTFYAYAVDLSGAGPYVAIGTSTVTCGAAPTGTVTLKNVLYPAGVSGHATSIATAPVYNAYVNSTTTFIGKAVDADINLGRNSDNLVSLVQRADYNTSSFVNPPNITGTYSVNKTNCTAGGNTLGLCSYSFVWTPQNADLNKTFIFAIKVYDSTNLACTGDYLASGLVNPGQPNKFTRCDNVGANDAALNDEDFILVKVVPPPPWFAVSGSQTHSVSRFLGSVNGATPNNDNLSPSTTQKFSDSIVTVDGLGIDGAGRSNGFYQSTNGVDNVTSYGGTSNMIQNYRDNNECDAKQCPVSTKNISNILSSITASKKVDVNTNSATIPTAGITKDVVVPNQIDINLSQLSDSTSASGSSVVQKGIVYNLTNLSGKTLLINYDLTAAVIKNGIIIYAPSVTSVTIKVTSGTASPKSSVMVITDSNVNVVGNSQGVGAGSPTYLNMGIITVNPTVDTNITYTCVDGTASQRCKIIQTGSSFARGKIYVSYQNNDSDVQPALQINYSPNYIVDFQTVFQNTSITSSFIGFDY